MFFQTQTMTTKKIIKKKEWTAGIIGGRKFMDWDFMVYQLRRWQDTHGEITSIVSGGAKGADSLANDYSKKFLNKKALELRPDYEKYSGNKAISLRNAYIVKKSQVIIAFPDATSHGTWNTIRMAKKRNIPIYVYKNF